MWQVQLISLPLICMHQRVEGIKSQSAFILAFWSQNCSWNRFAFFVSPMQAQLQHQPAPQTADQRTGRHRPGPPAHAAAQGPPC